VKGGAEMNSDKIIKKAEAAIKNGLFLNKSDLVPGMLVVEVDQAGKLLVYQRSKHDKIPTDPRDKVERMNVFSVMKTDLSPITLVPFNPSDKRIEPDRDEEKNKAPNRMPIKQEILRRQIKEDQRFVPFKFIEAKKSVVKDPYNRGQNWLHYSPNGNGCHLELSSSKSHPGSFKVYGKGGSPLNLKNIPEGNFLIRYS
jgi:hypothetical protein